MRSPLRIHHSPAPFHLSLLSRESNNRRYDELTKDSFIGLADNPLVQSSTSNPLSAPALPNSNFYFPAAGAHGANAQDASSTHGPGNVWSSLDDQEMLYSPRIVQPSQLQASTPSLKHMPDQFSFVPNFPQHAGVPMDFFTMAAEESYQDASSISFTDSPIAPFINLSNDPRTVFHEPILPE